MLINTTINNFCACSLKINSNMIDFESSAIDCLAAPDLFDKRLFLKNYRDIKY